MSGVGRSLRLTALVAVVTSISACASGTALTQTGRHYPPRNPRCDFLAFAAKPGDDFFEIGSVEVDPKSWKPFHHIEDFKAEIRPYVCKAGGHAVIAYVNGKGWYIKATVLRHVEKPASPAPSSTPAAPVPGPVSPAPPAPTPPQPPASATGCQYDTQCKGDRICSQGSCVAP